jgi:hypothetical protein
MRKILLLVFLILSLKSFASHLSGGWIEAEVINNKTVKVRLKLIQDCYGIPFSFISESVDISLIPSNPSQVMGTSSHTLNLVDTNIIKTYCNNVSFSCNGGANQGYRMWIYEGIVQLASGSFNSVRISYAGCCSPNNIVNNSGVGIAFYTDLFQLNSIQNSTPTRLSFDVVANVNDSNLVSYSHLDNECDSIVYQIDNSIVSVNPISLNPFNLGYSLQNPFGIGLYSYLDPNNGNYSFNTSAIIGIYQTAVVVKEYRQGQLLSITHSEQPILSNPTPANFKLKAIGDLNKTFKPCNTDSITYITNFNANDSIVIEVDSLQNYPGATLNVTNINASQKKAVFSWQPPYSAISLKKDKVVFRMTKFVCPYKKQFLYTTTYNVNACLNDSVWPGDINVDKTVNLIDGIYLAIALGETGSPRINPTINWTPQFATNWTKLFLSNSNYKHADTDGNGVVQLTDALAIALNFNLSHPKSSLASNNHSNKIGSSIYDPAINIGNAAYTGTGSLVNMPVSIGDATKKVLGANAVLFKIDADPAIIDGATLTFIPNTGIINNISDIVVTQYRDVNSADLYVAFAKKNNGFFSGFGNMGTLNFQIKSNATLGNSNLKISHAELYGPNMYPQPVKSGPNKIINVVLGVSKTAGSQFNISPNPFLNTIAIENEKPINAYKVFDLTGKLLLQKEANTTKLNINTESLNSGVYFIQIQSNGDLKTARIVKN